MYLNNNENNLENLEQEDFWMERLKKYFNEHYCNEQ